MKRSVRIFFAIVTLALVPGALSAQYRGGARTNVNQNRNYNQNVNRNVNVNQNVNVNRNVNVNVNNNVNVHGGYYGGSYYRGGYYGGGCCYNPNPVATAAAVTATAVVTAAVVGSVVKSVPPSCSAVIVNGLSYQHCGNTWYQPQFSGSTTTYIVVNQPH
jgi:hypothetical protein